MKLEDTRVTRRYFDKFAKITSYLTKVAATMETEGRFDRQDIDVMARYLMALTCTFTALSMKYLWSGAMTGRFGSLTLDRRESGFPVDRRADDHGQ